MGLVRGQHPGTDPVAGGAAGWDDDVCGAVAAERDGYDLSHEYFSILPSCDLLHECFSKVRGQQVIIQKG